MFFTGVYLFLAFYFSYFWSDITSFNSIKQFGRYIKSEIQKSKDSEMLSKEKNCQITEHLFPNCQNLTTKFRWKNNKNYDMTAAVEYR